MAILAEGDEYLGRGPDRMELIQVDSVCQREDRNTYTCRRLHGSSDVYSMAAVDTPPEVRLLDGAIYAWHVKSMAFVRLDPLIAWRVCPHCGMRRIFLAESASESGAVYMTSPVANCPSMSVQIE